MNSEIFSIFLIIAILFVFVCVLVTVYRILRRRGGSMVTTMLGATYEMHGEDKKRAIEAIVEQKAGQKMEEQRSSDPKDK